MGDNVYYISFMTMKEIAKRISLADEVHQNRNLGELIQRQVTNRSTEIATYLRTQPQRFFNALIIGVYGGAPEWYEISIQESRQFDPDKLPVNAQSALGILKLDGREKLFAIDGQHRVAGIKAALGSARTSLRLGDEEICTIFLAANVTEQTGLERTRRLFSTLNRYAKAVDMMEIIALDEDDAIAITTRRLLEEYPLFKGHRISVRKGKAQLVSDNESFTNITTLYEVNDTILADRRGRKWKEFKSFRPSDVVLSRFYSQATNFWQHMIRHFQPLMEVQNGISGARVAGQYRNRRGGHLLFRTIGLLAMAKAIKLATGTVGTWASWIRQFARLPMDLASEPWAGLLWDPVTNRMKVQREYQNTATLLLLYMLGIDLTHFKSSEEDLRKRYAGALNREVEEVQLPHKIS
jgi:DNA sulfur modification protein DndB